QRTAYLWRRVPTTGATATMIRMADLPPTVTHTTNSRPSVPLTRLRITLQVAVWTVVQLAATSTLWMVDTPWTGSWRRSTATAVNGWLPLNHAATAVAAPTTAQSTLAITEVVLVLDLVVLVLVV